MEHDENQSMIQASDNSVKHKTEACDSEEAKQGHGDSADKESPASAEGSESRSDFTGAESAFSDGSDACFSYDRDSKETRFWKWVTRLIFLITAIAIILVIVNLADEVNVCAAISCVVLFMAVLGSIWFSFGGEEILREKLKSFPKELWSLLKRPGDFLKGLWGLLRRPKDLLERLQGLLRSARSLLERLKSQLKELIKKIWFKALIILILTFLVVGSVSALASVIESGGISAFIILVMCPLFMAFAIGVCICWKPDSAKKARDRAIGVATIASVTGILLTIATILISNQSLSDCTAESYSSNEVLVDTLTFHTHCNTKCNLAN